MTNRGDGRPVRAIIQYYPLRDNPQLKECADASFLDNNVSDEDEFSTDANGKFRAVALPGGGILTVRTVERNFLTAMPLSPKDAGNVLHAANFDYQMKGYQALVPINAGDAESVTLPDIVVTRGRTLHVKVVGPDGKPVAATRLFKDLKTTRFERFSVQPPTGPDGRFRIVGLSPGVNYNVDAIKNNTANYSERSLGSIDRGRWTVKPGEIQDWGDVQVKKYSQ